MLGSCSKDDTEVAPIDVQGKLAFSAVMTIGNDTRTGVAVDGNALKYTWDLGDMVGATVVGQSEVVPFINKTTDEASKTANFYYAAEDLDYLGGEKVYLAYPYEKDNTVDADGNISLTIPATQRYRAGSFAQMTAPAVAYVPKFEDGAEYTFDAVSSFVRVPVTGFGNVSKIEMQIKKDDGNGAKPMKIAGSANVDVDSETPALTVPADASEWGETITLDFGKKGLDLSYPEKQYIVYVIPAGLELTAEKTVFEFKATFSDQSTSTATFTVPVDLTMPVNHMQGLGTISLGTEDKVLIENNADLLEYLYTVSQNTDGDKTAVLVNDINFSRYDARNDINGAENDMLEALTEYLTNGSAINSIAAGAKIDGNGHIISNLQVSGNGIFAGQPDALKNLTLSAVTVNVPDEANPALFVGAINLASCSEGLAIKGGYLKNVAEDATAALIQNAYLTTLPLADKVTISYPRVNESSGAYAYYASKLILQDDVDASGDLKAYFNSATPRFGAIVADSKDVAISNVSSAYVSGLLDAIQYGEGSKAISVIDNKGTSYWTGGVASAAPANGAVETAEQLAYVVANGGSKLTLANNIDLQHKVWTVAGKTVSLDGADKKIMNVNIVADDKLDSGVGYYSLLGNKVTVTDLNVSDVTIDVQTGAGHKAYVGGLGISGSVNNVAVTGLSINVGEDVVLGSTSVGGMISTLSANSNGNIASGVSIEVKAAKVAAVGGMFGTVTTASFNNNTLDWADGVEPTSMIGTWTVTKDTDVAKCKSAEGVAFINFINVKGESLQLTFDDCTAKEEGIYWNDVAKDKSISGATTIWIDGKATYLD